MPGHQRAGDPVIAQSSAQALDWRGAGDQLMDVTGKILHQANLPNIQKVHKIIGARVVAVVQESRNA